MLPTAQHESLAVRVRAIYRDARSMYRAHFAFITGSAALVLVPFAVLDGLGLLRFETSCHSTWITLVTVFAALRRRD